MARRAPRERDVVVPREHLLLVTHHYGPEHGAPQRRWDGLVPRFQAAGTRVTVLAPPPHYPGGSLDPAHRALRPGTQAPGEHGERVVRVRFREHTPRLLSRTADQVVVAVDSVWQGWRRLRRPADRPTVVVGTVPGIPSMVAAWALARLFRARLVVEMRDAWPDLIRPSGILADTRRSTLRSLVTTAVHRAIVRLQGRADLVVTTTTTFAEVVARRGARRVGVVRNGTHRLPDDRRTGTAPQPRDGRPFRVLYAGTIGRSQGLDVVVEAAARLAEAGVPLEVRLVGAGSEAPRLAVLARRLAAPVEVLPRVPRTMIDDLYAWADTVVVSLRDWQPFEWTVPSKLYEVLATGRHVTGCLAGEAAEMVRSLGGGDVVPPGDVAALAALWIELATSSPARLEVSPDARAWVEQHANDDALAERYLALLAGMDR